MTIKPLSKIMNYSAFFLAAGALAMLGVFLFAQPATAQRTGPYMLVAHSNETSNVGIFRINQANGMVSFCSVEGGASSAIVRCTPEVQ